VTLGPPRVDTMFADNHVATGLEEVVEAADRFLRLRYTVQHPHTANFIKHTVRTKTGPATDLQDPTLVQRWNRALRLSTAK
jgi:hypothetical protein